MIGNLWEWTADWFGQGPDAIFTNNSAIYGQDSARNVDAAQLQGAASEFPAAAIRGGSWDLGASAGAFALNLDLAPSFVSSSVGARCCNQR